MGIYYQARTIIGYKITDIRRYNEVVIPSCEHVIPAGAQFCPMCGKKAGIRTKREWRDEWNAFEISVQEDLPDELTYEEDFENDSAFWIGYGSKGVEPGESSMIAVCDYGIIKDKIMQFLDPYIKIKLFIVDEQVFGIWTTHIGR